MNIDGRFADGRPSTEKMIAMVFVVAKEY